MNISTETRLKPQEFRWLGAPVVQHEAAPFCFATLVHFFGSSLHLMNHIRYFANEAGGYRR